MNYTKRLQALGNALDVIHTFNRDYDASEGVKARLNHLAAGLLADMSDEDKSIVFSEMDWGWIEQLGCFNK